MNKEDFSVNFNLTDNISSATRSVWFKQFIEGINAEIKSKEYTLYFNLKIFCVKAPDIREIINLFNDHKVFFQDALTIFHEKGLIKLHYIKKDNYFEISPSIICRAAENYNEITSFLNERFKHLMIDKEFSKKFTIYWYLSVENKVLVFKIVQKYDEIIHPNAYPYISDLDKYIADYLESTESVLLLTGSPGTGKTRLIKYILYQFSKKLKKSIDVSYSSDKEALASSSLFSDFINKDYDALALEDIDYELNSRKTGNAFMYKLLNSSDGLISRNSKKIILSTNLPSLNNTDKALLRPGRCFDVLKTRNLTKEESENFLKNFNKSIDFAKDTYSLAELYKIADNEIQYFNSNCETELMKVGFKA